MSGIALTGGCHCGAVRFSFTLPAAEVDLLDCNCSICSCSGYLHLIVAHQDFSLFTPVSAMTAYRFGSGAAEHLFCATCGVKSFYQPRSHPGAWSINWRCVDEGHGVNVHITPFDGRNWESARARLGDG